MPILAGIDGTGGGTLPGKKRDVRYDKDFDSPDFNKKSFVNRICQNNTGSLYRRGPVTLGGGLMRAIDDAVEHIVNSLKNEPNADVLLTGYSRGAAGAVVVAKRLQKKGINVKAMMLFDCVDRHLFIDAAVIPNNVGSVLHIRRSKDARSRESFGNDGTQWNPPTVYQQQMFKGTHGAMGGTYWKPEGDPPYDPNNPKWREIIDEGGIDGKTAMTYAADKECSDTIWGYVLPFLREHGFYH